MHLMRSTGDGSLFYMCHEVPPALKRCARWWKNGAAVVSHALKDVVPAQAGTHARPASTTNAAKQHAPNAWRGIVAAACVLVAQAGAAQPVSVAETLLFQTNHLHNVRAPQTLTYAMRKEGSLEPGFVDEVQVVLAAGPQAGKPTVTMHFLTGARERPVPDADNPQGNPVLLGFLERDIAEMARLTGGAGNYFRKRIRLALAQAAQVQPRRFTYAGKAFDGREITITPYLNDPLHQRFEQYVNKRYTFVVSAQLPGGLYQVRSAVAGPAGAPPLIDETLTLVGAESGKH